MMTTFLHQGELNIPTSNPDINECLADVRKQTGRDWQIVERVIYPRAKWYAPWKQPPSFMAYELYVYVGGMGPWQNINFYSETSGSSINPTVRADIVVAYLLGILTGLNSNVK